MPGLIQILIFSIFTLLLGMSTPAPANTSYLGNLTNPVQPALASIEPANQSLKRAEGQFIKFGMTVPDRPVNGKYSLAFTIESAGKDSVLREGKVAAGTKRRAGARIILDIPGRIEDKKNELSCMTLARKGGAAGGRLTFHTVGSADLPAKAKLILKRPSGKILDFVEFEALGESKEGTEGSNKGRTSVAKLPAIGKSGLPTEPVLLEFAVSTGGFFNSVITIFNGQDQPLHVKGYLQYILVKSSLSSFSFAEGKGYSPDLVMIEPSELDLQAGEKRKLKVICQVPKGEEERYYARVVLELDFPDEKEAGLDNNREATEELSPASKKFQETSSNLDEALEFMIAFRRPGKVILSSNRKMAPQNYRAMVEEITSEGQVEFAFPEGIRDLKAAYDKRLPPAKYLAEVSFKHGNRMLISQSHLFLIE